MFVVGLTIAPSSAADGWREAYAVLIEDAATALAGVPGLDLSIKFITHRFTAGSKAVLETWYPGLSLDMREAGRTTKRTKFGTEKQVYDAATIRDLHHFFKQRIELALPVARILY